VWRSRPPFAQIAAQTRERQEITMKVYPCGYAKYAALIMQLMQDHPQLILIDTRFNPWSSMPMWRKETLKATYGERYRWAGQALGNLNYKNGGPICLADPITGLRGLSHWLQHDYDLLLLCGCAIYEQCHLQTIVTELLIQMPETEVVLPEQLTQPQHTKCLSIRQPWTWILTHPTEVAACGIEPKTLENRDWYSHYRGPLLLHAGATLESSFFHRRTGLLLPDYWEGKFGEAGARLVAAMPQHRKDYPTRAIVGSATLVDIVEESSSPWFVGDYGFVLTEARTITPPVNYLGQRMLFDVPDTLITRSEEVQNQ
jgi:hypothetical protein